MPEKVVVTVKEGRVCGLKTKTAYSGAEYYSFLGVPYGQSTGGSARYKDPVKIKPWNNIVDATVAKDGCTQFSLQAKNFTGSEDCLYNNIYTPQLPLNRENPSMRIVDPWYYGAADFVMYQDIVDVCAGYRLHVFGCLLNSHMENCSGNQCLKSYYTELEMDYRKYQRNWRRSRQHNSNGQQQRIFCCTQLAVVTFGQSTTIGMYAFSPVINRSTDHAGMAYEIAQMMGYDGLPDEDKNLLAFYRTLQFPKFALARPELFFNKSTLQVYPASPFTFTPEPGENSPLPEWPNKLIPLTNRVPIMIGFSEREASMALALLRTLETSISSSFHRAIHQNPWGWGAALNDDRQCTIGR